VFDDSRLEDTDALAGIDAPLRHLAQAGARLRIEAGQADLSTLGDLGDRYRPRAVIASGPEARLIRAVLEPSCPVPFVAWPMHALPAWVGPLDLVIVLTDKTYDPDVSGTIAEAVRGAPASSSRVPRALPSPSRPKGRRRRSSRSVRATRWPPPSSSSTG
jgi:hypothetical protein